MTCPVSVLCSNSCLGLKTILLGDTSTAEVLDGLAVPSTLISSSVDVTSYKLLTLLVSLALLEALYS